MSDYRKPLRDLCRMMIAERIPLAEAVGIFEDQYVTEVVSKTGGKITAAARMANCHRNTIHRKLRNG